MKIEIFWKTFPLGYDAVFLVGFYCDAFERRGRRVRGFTNFDIGI